MSLLITPPSSIDDMILRYFIIGYYCLADYFNIITINFAIIAISCH